MTTVEGQAPNTNANDQAEQGSAVSGSSSGQAPDIEQRLAVLERENRKLRDEAASNRVKAKEEANAKTKALEEQGQYKALADELKERLAVLEGVDEDAKAYRKLRDEAKERVKQKLDKLPESMKALVASADPLTAERAILDFERERAAHKPPVGDSGGAPPGTTTAVSDDLEAAARSGNLEAYRAAKTRDPKAYAGWMAKLTGRSNAPQTTWARLNGSKP